MTKFICIDCLSDEISGQKTYDLSDDKERALWASDHAGHATGLIINAPLPAAASALNGREREVMEMLARGATNREIATRLAISIKTIDTHRAHVLKKLDVRNNSELTRFAIRNGYVAP